MNVVTLRLFLNPDIPCRSIWGKQETKTRFCKIPCECGRLSAGETGRHLAVKLRDDKCNLKQGHLDESKLAQHAAEEDHKTEQT